MASLIARLAHLWVRTRVGGLLLVRRPSTILWGVALVIIYAIQSFALRPWPHVGQELTETAAPAPLFADSNAAPAVIGVGVAIGIVAALIHMRPRLVFRWSLSQGRNRVAMHDAIGSTSDRSRGTRLGLRAGLQDDGHIAMVSHPASMKIAVPIAAIGAVAAFNGAGANGRLRGHREITPSGVWRLGGAIAVAVSILLFVQVRSTAAFDHLTYLPLVPNTPLMQSIIQTQTVKYCVNATGQTYPNFVSQLEDVHAAYARDVGIRFERVAWGSMASTGCQVQHNLTEFSCNGCAAHIFYANWPVVVEYKVSLGYTDWRSAFGHELGHGLLGLHEQYKDSGGTIGCTFRPDTVMSCGSPFVKYPQPRDVNLGCAIIKTTWCGAQTPPVFPFWDGDEWVFESGWKYNPSTPSPYYGTPGNWVHTNGTQEFSFVTAVEGGEQWFNYRENAYHMKGSTFWRHAGGSAWICLAFCFPAP